jgi:hypothetical protein
LTSRIIDSRRKEVHSRRPARFIAWTVSTPEAYAQVGVIKSGPENITRIIFIRRVLSSRRTVSPFGMPLSLIPSLLFGKPSKRRMQSSISIVRGMNYRWRRASIFLFRLMTSCGAFDFIGDNWKPSYQTLDYFSISAFL